MDFVYSPHREGGGTMHLPSPTHHHGYGMEIPSSIQQLRRSLSRSPSKPSRFQLRKSDSPGSPISPLALARAFSPRTNNHSPITTFPESSASTQPPPTTTKKRFTLRRTAGFRSSPRTRAASKSPRRVLADSSDHGNSTPFMARRTSGEEKLTARKSSLEILENCATEQKPTMRYGLDDKPIKFEYGRSRPDLTAPSMPAKSSPLKRSDGIMNLDAVHGASPVAKRRSLHGASAFGSDFDVFDYAPATRVSGEEQRRDVDITSSFSFSSPVTKTQSPLRKTSSLRKSTLSQRYGANTSRPKQDGEFALPGLAASKTRNRMSLDSSLSFSSVPCQSPFRRSTNFDAVRGPSHQPFLRGGSGSHHPHPLSNALTPSTSSSNLVENSPSRPGPGPLVAAPVRNHVFSRSLPIGASRPQPPDQSSELSFETPMAFKMARPDPEAFKSTGLLSKKHKQIDDGDKGGYIMPDTPSKRYSFPPVTGSPSVERHSFWDFGKGKVSRPEFGHPSTPFSVHKQSSSASFGKGVSIFGVSNGDHQRRSSFASVDGDDNSHSPCGNHMTDSQSSCDDMPPTPTKNGDGSGRKKDSLRRRTFRQQRVSLGADTFSAPSATEMPGVDIPLVAATPTTNTPFGSPQTPSEPFMPPDPSKLSISGHRRGSLSFNSSTNSNLFPPATPTTPRDHNNFFAPTGAAPVIGLTQNDVDPSLSERFDSVTLLGNGEFSKVYRVEKQSNGLGFISPHANRIWAVKKAKKPYTGPHDRDRKLREVRILEDLRGHDHIVRLDDHWEHNGHLYIQTEFCEERDLSRFLTEHGRKSRLDDFRLWKILLELSAGIKHIHDSGYIHLDLKPANVLITFGGNLKIADFGLATRWPADRHIDGEGDRHYLAPEALEGQYDKPNDVFALGMIICEMAGNILLPENGTSWQRLRTGDFSELPSLTWSSESSLNRDSTGEPLSDSEDVNCSTETICNSECDDELKHLKIPPKVHQHPGGLETPPNFMVDDQDPDSLHQIALWMIDPNPAVRPTIDHVYRCYGCQWVEGRSRAGATIYEGNWGPLDDVLNHHVQDADIMDTS